MTARRDLVLDRMRALGWLDSSGLCRGRMYWLRSADGAATGGRLAVPVWAEVMKRVSAARTAWAIPGAAAIPPLVAVRSTAAAAAPRSADTPATGLSDSLVVQ